MSYDSIILGSLALTVITYSWVPAAVLAVLAIAWSYFFPNSIHMKIHWWKCIRNAVLLFFFAPYLMVVVPGGGRAEQVWLDKVVQHIEAKRDVCQDPEMKEILDYTARRYNSIGTFGVKVVQLPVGLAGLNAPFVPGMTVDVNVMRYNAKWAASVIVHEAMHEYFPYFGHYHIDDNRILEAL